MIKIMLPEEVEQENKTEQENKAIQKNKGAIEEILNEMLWQQYLGKFPLN